MKKTISTRADIELLVNEFYKKLPQDELIGRFFTEVVSLSWERHIPVMYSFWETVLLGTMSYRGNPMLAHIDLDRKSPLEPAHFERWKQLWAETLDAHFEGDKVAEAKKKADTMAQLMLFKIGKSREEGFVF